MGVGVAAAAGAGVGGTTLGLALSLKDRLKHTTTPVTHLMNLTEGTETTSIRHFWFISNKFMNLLECGPMPNVMVALPNIGGALCSTPQSLADAHY